MKAQQHSRRLRSALFFALSCAALLLPATASAQYSRDQAITLGSFRPNERAEASRHRLRDGDVIMLTQQTDRNIPLNQVEIVLQTASEVTWWKEIKLTTGTYLGPDHYRVDKRVTVKSASTQDQNHGPTVSFRFNIWEITDAYGGLVFSKAKFLGEHTEVYYLPAFELITGNMGGKRLTFTWQVD